MQQGAPNAASAIVSQLARIQRTAVMLAGVRITAQQSLSIGGPHLRGQPLEDCQRHKLQGRARQFPKARVIKKARVCMNAVMGPPHSGAHPFCLSDTGSQQCTVTSAKLSMYIHQGGCNGVQGVGACC